MTLQYKGLKFGKKIGIARFSRSQRTKTEKKTLTMEAKLKIWQILVPLLWLCTNKII